VIDNLDQTDRLLCKLITDWECVSGPTLNPRRVAGSQTLSEPSARWHTGNRQFKARAYVAKNAFELEKLGS
jgi:hypothetical protein